MFSENNESIGKYEKSKMANLQTLKSNIPLWDEGLERVRISYCHDIPFTLPENEQNSKISDSHFYCWLLIEQKHNNWFYLLYGGARYKSRVHWSCIFCVCKFYDGMSFWIIIDTIQLS